MSRLSARAFLAMILILAGAAMAQTAGKVTRAFGPALIHRAPAEAGAQPAATPATKAAALRVFDALVTGEGGRMRVQFADGSILSLGSASRVMILLYDAPTKQLKLALEYGTVRIELQRGSQIDVATKDARSVLLGGDTIVDVGVDDTVIGGHARVRSSEAYVPETVEVKAGQYAVVRPGSKPEIVESNPRMMKMYDSLRNVDKEVPHASLCLTEERIYA